ncbi:unnamed protein product [Cyprideis torosa]|uniref:Uncharacterized protein n=1 Tax=Cyprideis torosa TaxID=163714 RepID=A0A7R8WI04_9CRUS|nr:unnamed protein product [Cyprideis torosa]CAG0900097.1 unnamed protein product [Cyprideis torosa]
MSSNATAQSVVALAADSCLPDHHKPDTRRVLLHPWIRIDGSLNRKVLDRFLGGVLGFLIRFPGSTLEAIEKHFYPALSVAQTMDLLAQLCEIGCVTCARFHRPSTGFSLFDPPPVLEEDAIPRLGHFMGIRNLENYDFLVSVLGADSSSDGRREDVAAEVREEVERRLDLEVLVETDGEIIPVVMMAELDTIPVVGSIPVVVGLIPEVVEVVGFEWKDSLDFVSYMNHVL